jgi:hypothetical protein
MAIEDLAHDPPEGFLELWGDAGGHSVGRRLGGLVFDVNQLEGADRLKADRELRRALPRPAQLYEDPDLQDQDDNDKQGAEPWQDLVRRHGGGSVGGAAVSSPPANRSRTSISLADAFLIGPSW